MLGKCWEEKTLEGCPKLEPLVINMPWDIWSQVLIMTASVKTEWLGYFRGDVDGDEATVTGLIVPEQDVSAASVKVKEEIEDVIGVIHSHPFSHNQPAFSGTDDGSININHYFSIVISKNGEHEEVSRQLTLCGEWCLGEAILEISEPEFVTEAKKKLHSFTPRTVVRNRTTTGQLTLPREKKPYDERLQKLLAEEQHSAWESDPEGFDPWDFLGI